MEDKDPLERVRELLESQALPQTTEVAFSSTSGGRGVHVVAWDPRNGAIRKTYKSDSEGEGGQLCMAGIDYLLCSLKSRPFILVWKIDKESLHLQISCSGLVTAMACHPEGLYCVAAQKEKINIWEVSSGHLFAQLSRHYQPVTVLQFTTDGAFFLSGGKDCLAITWNLGSVLSDSRVAHCKQHPSAPPLLQWRMDGQRGTGVCLTRHVWSDHSLAITGLHCIGRGVRGRVVTASLDHSCKLYDFTKGALLCTFLFDFPLTAVRLDQSADWLAVGGKTGSIGLVPLFLPSQKQVNQVSCTGGCGGDQFICLLQEHKKLISSLAVSTIGNVLVSASEDSSCRVWDMTSKQTLQVMSLRGAVTGLLLHTDVWGLNSGKLVGRKEQWRLPLSAFRKQLYYSSAVGEREGEQEYMVTVVPKEGVHPLQVDAIDALDRLCGDEIESQCSLLPQRRRGPLQDQSGGLEGEAVRMKQEMKELKDVHRRLFSFAADRLLKETPK